MEQRNRLASEKSPYLLQHKDNPVHWFPWGPEAFECARRDNKPIFLSIGYSTCYWCHAMEHESFEHHEVADVLNRSFVSIKVDREEHPEVDQIYMDALLSMTGRGGWPMSMFLTPDLRPFFGGTFFPRDHFLRLLNRIAELWQSDEADIRNTAQQILDQLSTRKLPAGVSQLEESSHHRLFQALQQSYDAQNGGFGNAPKFPGAANIAFLLRYARRANSTLALKMAEQSLEKMARGGIFDQLGGGFHRYATDEKWLIPHFEKMLYDNALLAAVYLEAFQCTGKNLYGETARAVLDFLLRDLHDPQGGFFAALDAGAVGEEGDYYVWSDSEVEHALAPAEYERFAAAFGVSPQGNFEHNTTVLSLQDAEPWEARHEPLLQSAAAKLLRLRNARTKPACDTKILTAWNGLALSALAKGAAVLNDERYLRAAVDCALFCLEHLAQGDQLLRSWCGGDAHIPGCLEDYAYLIQGLLDLSEASLDPQWALRACALQEQQDRLFWDAGSREYFSAQDDPSALILRQKSPADGATPAPGSVAALNLLRLWHFTGEQDLRNRAEELFSSGAPFFERLPVACTSLMIAYDFYGDATKDVVIAGPAGSAEVRTARETIWRKFLPNKVLAFAPTGTGTMPLLPIAEEKTTTGNGVSFYVCEQQTCQAPTSDLAAVLTALESFRPLLTH